MKFWTDFRPATGALAVLVLFLAVGAAAQTNTLSDAEIQGRQLAQQLCEGRPTENSLSSGFLKIRSNNGNRVSLPVHFKVAVTTTNWRNFCEVTLSKRFKGNDTNSWDEEGDTIRITHSSENPNFYESSHFFAHISQDEWATYGGPIFSSYWLPLADDKLMTPFAGSDFWLCDLGLEFFHWPEQKVLPKTTNLKRGRDYTLLESTNPNPATNGYSRVLSWIDKETGGILAAEAYDFNGRLLKEFAPKSFKKVSGQWELQEMEIDNVQTGSRTRLEFDLKK
jgi:hypothetical protein